jgi:NAD(P) transhydrogenase
MRSRTRHVCESLQATTRANIEKSRVEYVEGVARLGPGGTVTVTEPGGVRRELRGTAVLIATGSRPARPANVPFDHPGICDTDTVLARGWVPKAMVIVGGGAVAVEFATIAHALGARVTLVERASPIACAPRGGGTHGGR